MKRFLAFCCIIRVNQIEISSGLSIGVDERFENTPENLAKYRDAVHRAFPGGKITFALSWQAIFDKSPQFVTIREMLKNYHEEYGDEVTIFPGGYFGSAYLPRKTICKEMEEMLGGIKAFMGKCYLPKCIIAGFMPSDCQRFIAEKLKIKSIQGNIFSQYAVDNQDGDGSICYPYYTSREHFCKPSQNEKDLIDIVNMDGWTVDFLCAVHCGMDGEINSRMGVGPIETLRPYGEKKGLDIQLATAALHFDNPYNEFAYVTNIWELCLIEKNGHHRMNVYDEGIYNFLKGVRERWPDVEMITHGQFGEWFRVNYPDNSKIFYRFYEDADKQVLPDTLKGQKIWLVMNRDFRKVVLKKEDKYFLIDYTNYRGSFKEPRDSNYKKGLIQRNWSLFGKPNMKGLRECDRPVELSPDEAQRFFSEYGLNNR